jgi:cytochrome P450
MSDVTPNRDWDPLAPETFRDAPATYADLRRRCPVAHTDRWGGFWALMKYKDIVAVASDSDGFITSVQNLVPASPRSGVPRRPLQVDPPEHAHFRRAMNSYFEEERVAHLEPALRQVAVRYLEPLLTKGGGDAVKEYAQHLPIRMLCAFLGVPEEDATFIQKRSTRYVYAISQDDHAAAKTLSGELDEYARRLVAARQAAPLDPAQDIVSGLLVSQINNQPIEDEVIAGFVRGLIVAGDRSTANGIASSILHLARHAGLQEQLRREPLLIPAAVEEFIRLYAPSHATARTATHETRLGGRTIRTGEVVAMVFLAGNRDPEIFPEPDQCILERKPNRHLGFGHGVHKCAGQSLARMQLRVAVEELLAHTTGFELDGPVDQSTWPEYGPRSLPLRFTV